MDGGHKTLDDAELVVDDLSQGGQAVGGAGGVGDDIHIGGVGIVVDAHNEGGGLLILGGGGDDNLLGAALQVGLALFGGGEDAGGFHHVFHAHFAPGDLLRVHLVKGLDLLAVDEELAVLGFGDTVEAAMDGVILGHVGHVVGADEGIVHRHHLKDLRLGHRDAEHQSADAAEAIDANFDCHTNTLL